ncbi:MAG: glycosyltransferase family 4 protein [Nitrospinae bacterium]|nr:glycosyltransferase family 4 protein [Nitrospinota bacterium]
MRKLSIIQLNRHGPGGGGSEQAFHLARALQRRGHRVLFVTTPDERWRKRCDAAGLPLACLPMHSRFNLVMAARLAALIRREGAQVVHAHKGREQALAFWASCCTRIPVLVANRGVSFPVGRLRALKYRWRTDAVVAVSEAVHRELLASGVPPSKVITIYGGVDVQRFHPGVNGAGIREELGIPSAAQLVTKVAHHRSWKGYEVFLQAAAIVSRVVPTAFFLGVGKGTDGSPQLDSLVQRLGLRERVRWAGFREDLPQILAASDLCVHAATTGEGLTGAVREALAMAKPVVVTDVGGNRELIIDGETGRLVPPHDPERLAEGMVALLQAPQDAAAMGWAGRQIVERRFSHDAKAERMEQLYLGILRRKGYPHA